MVIIIYDAAVVFGLFLCLGLGLISSILSAWNVIKILLWIGLGICVLFDFLISLEKDPDERLFHCMVHGIAFLIIAGVQQYWLFGLDKMINGEVEHAFLNFLIELPSGGLVVLLVASAVMWVACKITGDDYY